MVGNNDLVHLLVESPDGAQFACEVPGDTLLSTVAAEFYAHQNWELEDGHGRQQRVVVDMVDPRNPGRTKRVDPRCRPRRPIAGRR